METTNSQNVGPAPGNDEPGNDSDQLKFRYAGWSFNSKNWADIETEDERKNFESELFEDNKILEGTGFGEVIKMKSTIKGEDAPEPINSFEKLNLASVLLENVTKLMKYKELTPVQRCVIPCISSGRDILACSQTGSGKTASFLIPIVNSLLASGRSSCADEVVVNKTTGIKIVFPRALIISPIRELAIQTHEESRKFAYSTWIRPAVIYGGIRSSHLLTQLNDGAHILCATLGKLIDFIDSGKISLSKIRFVVIDEADRIFNRKDSAEDALRVLKQYDLPSDESKQISLFSATFPKPIRSLIFDILIDPVLVTIEKVTDIPINLEQRVLFVENDQKFETLLSILYKQEPGKTLIFANSAAVVDTIDDALYRKKFPVTSIHSERNQHEREDSIIAFRRNVKPILVATDVASRGLDVPNVAHVINYEMPFDIESYVHRIGRTARLGNKGLATTFFNYESEKMARPLADILISHKQSVPDFLRIHSSALLLNGGPVQNDIIDDNEISRNSSFPSNFEEIVNRIAGSGSRHSHFNHESFKAKSLVPDTDVPEVDTVSDW